MLENRMQWSMQVMARSLPHMLLSNTQLDRFQALPFASVSPSVLMKFCLEGDISWMFPLLALLFAFHILKNKKQTSKQNLARGFFPKLPAMSQTLPERRSAASHWGAHLCVPLLQAGLCWCPYIGAVRRSPQRRPGVVTEPVGEGLALWHP